MLPKRYISSSNIYEEINLIKKKNTKRKQKKTTFLASQNDIHIMEILLLLKIKIDK